MSKEIKKGVKEKEPTLLDVGNAIRTLELFYKIYAPNWDMEIRLSFTNYQQSN